MAWSKEDKSFKTLINKRSTSETKGFYEETGDFTVNVHGSEIWVSDISATPSEAVSAGVAELRDHFTLTEDTSVASQQCYYAFSGSRLKDWIGDKYGTGYKIRLFDNNDTEIFPTNPSNWIFDYQTGILTFDGSTASFAKPFKVTGYRYIGVKGVSGGGSSGLQGVTGAQGIQGVTGPSAGAQGETGAQGVTGPSGGQQGETGLSGKDGSDGATGVQGIQGVTGPSGGGTSGLQGETGAQGETGLSGLNGTDGVTGLQGETGLSGLGVTGPSGIQGATGAQGIQGATGPSGGSQGFTGLIPSVAGYDWTIRVSATDATWSDLCYGNGLFVAVANSGTNRVMTSPDGFNWTSRTAAEANSWRGVCYGNGLFVAVSSDGTNRVMTSPDGITWTSRLQAENNLWYSVCYGNGLFVAVSQDGTTNRIMTSPDGINWTARAANTQLTWFRVCYGNGLFVAIASSGSNNRVMTSSDGITWALDDLIVTTNTWRGICYGNGLFVAVSSDGTNRVMTSPDGFNWTFRSAAEASAWNNVCYGNGLFVAVAYSGTNRVMTSPDGITWTSRTQAANNSWYGVHYGNDLFVAVSGDGETGRVMTSGSFDSMYEQNNHTHNIINNNVILRGDLEIKGAAATCKSLGIKRTAFTPIMKPKVLNLALTDADLVGFNGGFSDDRYGYFVPDKMYASGKVARVALNDFSSVSVLDLTLTDPNLKGFQGGFTDGRYGYFIPNYYSTSSGKLVRVDLNDFSTVTVLNLTSINATLSGFIGGFTDGKYGYLVPNYNILGSAGVIARIDLNDFSTVTTLDLPNTTGDNTLKGFRSGFTDGRYGYFISCSSTTYQGKVVRVDLNDFSTIAVLDLSLTDADLKGFYGSFTDGRYGYFVPYYINSTAYGKVARVDLNDFRTVSVLDLALTDSNLKGFYGGFTDGKYGYFVPSSSAISTPSGKIARVDLNDFSTVSVLDLTLTDSDLKGFHGGFTDGKYGYFVPNNNGAYFGKVARIYLSQSCWANNSI